MFAKPTLSNNPEYKANRGDKQDKEILEEYGSLIKQGQELEHKILFRKIQKVIDENIDKTFKTFN